MTTGAQHTSRADVGLARAAALALAALGAGCGDAGDGPGADGGEPSARQETDSGTVRTVTIRRTTPDTGQGAQVAAGQQGSSGQQGSPGQAGSPSGGDGATTPGDVSLQAAANVEDTLELGTFSPTTPPSGEDVQGRLPAPGDLTVYVPNTTLFPGSARLDPGIENPYSGDPNAIAAGERHFNAFNCSGCHAPFGGGGMGPPLSDDAWIHGSDPAQIYLTIVHGRPEGMPAFGSMLPRRAIWEMVAYIETLSEIDDFATHAGFDAEHSTSVYLESRFRRSGEQAQPQAQGQAQGQAGQERSAGQQQGQAPQQQGQTSAPSQQQ